MTARRCRRPGCNEPTFAFTDGLCEEHFRHTGKYVELSRRYRRTQPLCEACYAKDIITGGEEVDHKRSLKAGGKHVWENLQHLCKPCHFAKTAKENTHLTSARYTPPQVCPHGYQLTPDEDGWSCPICTSPLEKLNGTPLRSAHPG